MDSSSERGSRARRPPSWTKAYEVDVKDDLAEDEWAVKSLRESREVSCSSTDVDSDQRGEKRRQYLVEWEGDFEAEWLDEEAISPDLKRQFARTERQDRTKLTREMKALVRGCADRAVKIVCDKAAKTTGEGNALDGGKPAVVTLRPDVSPRKSLDVDNFPQQVKSELVWLFTMFLSSLSISSKSDSSLDYRQSFTIPCLYETFYRCFIVPFFIDAPILDFDTSYKLILSIEQVDKILCAVREKHGCPWYQRDSITSDASAIYGDIVFCWCRPVHYYFSHASCKRCAATYEEAVHPEDTGGLDKCNPDRISLSLPHQLKVSFNKKHSKSLHWKK